jgi:pimeloyl-ACP methyl ester carboxylesterase
MAAGAGLAGSALIGADPARALGKQQDEPDGGAVPVKTGRVTVEGDDLYYEIRGSGKPLLMISGGMGDAGFYTYVAPILADEYQVITYDRRGNSRSTRHDPQNFEISQQARDAVAVLKAAGHDSAYVFGNSAGAVIGLELARRHPQAVLGLVAHEPPVLRMLPDGNKERVNTAQVYAKALGGDVQGAMQLFAATVLVTPPGWFKSIPADYAHRTAGNTEYFVTIEMSVVSNYKPDTAAIKANKVKVVMAAGAYSTQGGAQYARTVPIVAEQIGCPVAEFPGHHLSYFDMPQEWAAALRKALRSFG